MVAVINWNGDRVGEANVELRVAKESSAANIVHRALIRQLNNARQGTACTKTRAEVRGGGRKPWRQKGTGRARAGSSRSPLWRGGGVIFGPKPKEYNIKMNRKERRLALRTAFSGRQADMVIVEDFTANLPQPKTRELVQALSRWGVSREEKVLLVVDKKQEAVNLSARNVANLVLLTADQLNIFDIVHAEKLVVTAPALDKIHAVYGETPKVSTPQASSDESQEAESHG